MKSNYIENSYMKPICLITAPILMLLVSIAASNTHAQVVTSKGYNTSGQSISRVENDLVLLRTGTETTINQLNQRIETLQTQLSTIETSLRILVSGNPGTGGQNDPGGSTGSSGQDGLAGTPGVSGQNGSSGDSGLGGNPGAGGLNGLNGMLYISAISCPENEVLQSMVGGQPVCVRKGISECRVRPGGSCLDGEVLTGGGCNSDCVARGDHSCSANAIIGTAPTPDFINPARGMILDNPSGGPEYRSTRWECSSSTRTYAYAICCK